MELAARVVKIHNIKVDPGEVPTTVISYLSSAHRCVNPKCKGEFLIILLCQKSCIFVAGVFFDNRIEHIKFVDFCGKYRIPLLQYLCSSKCITSRASEVQRPGSSYMMKKVLLG